MQHDIAMRFWFAKRRSSAYTSVSAPENNFQHSRSSATIRLSSISGASLAALALVPIIRLPTYPSCLLRSIGEGQNFFPHNTVTEATSMGSWFRDIWDAVSRWLMALWVTLRYWFKTYQPERAHIHREVRISRIARSCRRRVIAASIATT